MADWALSAKAGRAQQQGTGTISARLKALFASPAIQARGYVTTVFLTIPHHANICTYMLIFIHIYTNANMYTC